MVIFISALKLFDVESYFLVFEIQSCIDIREEFLAQNYLLVIVIHVGYVSKMTSESCITKVPNVHQESLRSHPDHIISKAEIDVAKISIILIAWAFGSQAEFVNWTIYLILIFDKIVLNILGFVLKFIILFHGKLDGLCVYVQNSNQILILLLYSNHETGV